MDHNIVIVILVIAVVVAAIFYSGILNPAPSSNNPEVEISSPTNGATITGSSVTVNIQASHFSIVDKLGQANVAGEGHVHFFKDVAVPTTPGVPAVTEPGTYAVSISNTYTWTDVSEGTHTFSVELVNNDHTPLEPAVYKTISVTVQAQASTVERYLMAENFAFNVSSFSVPAGSAVVLHFENMDSGIQHNFALYSTSSYTGQLYSGTIITGVNSITYTFIAPSEPGIYYFRCDVHPTLMTGTMIVT